MSREDHYGSGTWPCPKCGTLYKAPGLKTQEIWCKKCQRFHPVDKLKPPTEKDRYEIGVDVAKGPDFFTQEFPPEDTIDLTLQFVSEQVDAALAVPSEAFLASGRDSFSPGSLIVRRLPSTSPIALKKR